MIKDTNCDIFKNGLIRSLTRLHIKLFQISNRICAWDITDTATNSYYNGGARPFKSASALDKLPASEFHDCPFTRKQLKNFKYIGTYEKMFSEVFEKADEIIPEGNYEYMLKYTFGDNSKAYKTYKKKASPPQKSLFQPTLYIDFEAIDMNICGWYGELVLEDRTVTYEGIAKPFSNLKHLERAWNKIYSNILRYNYADIVSAKHIKTYENYFVSMFSKAKKIVTYGDTDALFVQRTFGDDLFNFFKIKNIDASFRSDNRVVSLDKLSKLCNVTVEGELHDPKYDVKIMRKCLEVIENL